LDRKQLHTWIKTYKKDEEESFRGQGKLSEEQLDIRRLLEEVKRLTMEKDILKKTTVFFSKEMK
jgi:transposase